MLIRRLFITFGTIIVSIILLVPLIIIVMVSFDGTGYLEFPPRRLTFSNYGTIVSSSTWRLSLFHSVEAALLATVIAGVCGILGALGVRELKAGVRDSALAVLVSPLILPTIVLGIGQDVFFSKLNLAGSVLGIGLGQSVLGFPIVLLLTVSGLSRFNDDIELAARSLGAHRVRRIVTVVLPAVAPYLSAGVVFAFLAAFDDLILALFLSGPSSATLPVTLWNAIQFEATPTLGVVATIILIIATALMTIGSLVRKRGSGAV